ncbi:hypothetical protein ACIRF8_12600 [Streptomyces sp. NPDC102406]|uniref:hypothetical protein n=1 Tax=Streptomyces sp. NPDC102406 TaxID=3366171 RepID=UPI00380943A2
MSTLDFFDPGNTYQRRRWLFQCLAVSPSPFNGEISAVGWLYRPGEPATATALDPDDWEHAGWVETAAAGDEEKATGTASATATPAGPLGAGTRNRLNLLRRTVTENRGEWPTRRAQRLYEHTYGPGDWHATARRDLQTLHGEGLLVLHYPTWKGRP